ncbi:MFS general substrate transporter [Aureobasidium pullulans]|uniref:MFS general substrate transporter n=1 Tax=Aureobasidium pullulans TaxID=5580 RepID=A0A4S9F4F5_AURPU|nr:MFS general substrate transporter [Aureobasidium pullulans]THX41024.1 MFS general substrate transporter [Aureobasidium pullulans]
MTIEDENDRRQATETSPLLGKQGPKPIDPSDGIVPDSAVTNGVIPEGEDGGDLERQTSLEERQKQYEGQPEMRKKMKVIFPALTIGVLLSAADQTIIVSSYGKIGSELKALNNVSWIATAYFLTLTSFQPLYGKMSDIFGRKSCLLFAYLVFGLGCLACGLAQNMNQLIAARAFAGIGGGGMTTVVSILMSDAVPLRERGKWQGYVNIIYATGAGTGAPLGGILADSIGWRWAFLGQVPLCVLAFVVVGSVLKLPEREQTDWKQKLRRIDFLGAAILICAVFTLLLALDRGSNVSWKANITIISISLSIPLFILFVFVEMKVASEPFAPGHIIFNRSLFACYLCNFFSFSGWLAALFYIPLYFQAVDGLTATQAGVRLIPGIIAGVSGSLFGGFYMQRTGKFYWLTVIAYTCLVVGMTTVFLFTGFVVNSTIGIIIGMCICGSGNGVGVTSTLIGLIANASREDQAVATACSYLFRSLGSVFGVSISATLANQSLRDNLASALSNGNAAAEIAERVRESLAYINTLEPGVRALVRECYAQSTRAAFGLEIGLVAGAAVSAWFIREKALSK